ncbi:hypothetical protein [Bifidobacterium leontopitheci]|uniref:Uncharacterized protein n=1 Tax=Bifidobacterium leontopitheci TaxID=2650774 RepID=A0A6I1GTC0_9BIFI|nr:hypothetical protein [Bifidobacterium leontopitheci]KAB7791428.1 hypothetical protein F7D09_0103 [Bifidobacterium leontopitheci]
MMQWWKKTYRIGRGDWRVSQIIGFVLFVAYAVAASLNPALVDAVGGWPSSVVTLVLVLLMAWPFPAPVQNIIGLVGISVLEIIRIVQPALYYSNAWLILYPTFLILMLWRKSKDTDKQRNSES